MLARHPLAGLPEADGFHLGPGRLCVLLTRHRQGCVVVGRAGDRDLLEDQVPPADGGLPRLGPRPRARRLGGPPRGVRGPGAVPRQRITNWRRPVSAREGAGTFRGGLGTGREFATVRDISAEGLGLCLGRRLGPDTLVTVEPLWAGARTLLARVVHATPAEGGWVHGCDLPARLGEEELARWVGGHAESPSR
jgi:hypothetical protein